MRIAATAAPANAAPAPKNKTAGSFSLPPEDRRTARPSGDAVSTTAVCMAALFCGAAAPIAITVMENNKPMENNPISSFFMEIHPFFPGGGAFLRDTRRLDIRIK